MKLSAVAMTFFVFFSCLPLPASATMKDCRGLLTADRKIMDYISGKYLIYDMGILDSTVLNESDRLAIGKILEVPTPTKKSEYEKVFDIYFEARTRTLTHEERDLLREHLQKVVYHHGESIMANEVWIEIPSFLQNTEISTLPRKQNAV